MKFHLVNRELPLVTSRQQLDLINIKVLFTMGLKLLMRITLWYRNDDLMQALLPVEHHIMMIIIMIER
jgi:hypothetical protein